MQTCLVILGIGLIDQVGKTALTCKPMAFTTCLTQWKLLTRSSRRQKSTIWHQQCCFLLATGRQNLTPTLSNLCWFTGNLWCSLTSGPDFYLHVQLLILPVHVCFRIYVSLSWENELYFILNIIGPTLTTSHQPPFPVIIICDSGVKVPMYFCRGHNSIHTYVHAA